MIERIMKLWCNIFGHALVYYKPINDGDEIDTFGEYCTFCGYDSHGEYEHIHVRKGMDYGIYATDSRHYGSDSD